MGGLCGNKQIVYDEEQLFNVAVSMLNFMPGALDIDPGLSYFEEYWNYEGHKSFKQGFQGGRQRMKSKLSAQLESLASHLVSDSYQCFHPLLD